MDVLQVKVILLGDPNVGKSSILYRFITGEYKEDLDPTIGANFLGKLVKLPTKTIKFNIWDTAGQERYNSFARMYCRDAKAVIFVFESGNSISFEALNKWNQLVNETNVDPNAKIYIVSNKVDLFRYHEVPKQILDFAEGLGARFFQVSAKMDIGISELFEAISKDVVNGNTKNIKFSLAASKHSVIIKEEKRKKCC